MAMTKILVKIRENIISILLAHLDKLRLDAKEKPGWKSFGNELFLLTHFRINLKPSLILDFLSIATVCRRA